MRYCTWKLVWSEDGYGIGPEQRVEENGGSLSASMWVDGGVESGTILGYATDDVDLSLLTDWSVMELSEADALQFAKSLDQTAYVADDGLIRQVRYPEDGQDYTWDEAAGEWVVSE